MLEAIFTPQSVAVVGASPDPTKLGHRVLKNVVENGYTGRILPIHPTAPRVLDLPAYPSISAVPDAIDLAVIVVPPQAVLAVVEECGRQRVRG
jgi:acetyltransferase